MLKITTKLIKSILNPKILYPNPYIHYFSTSSSLSQSQTPKKYILSQFPYPSGQLHLGHARVYYIGDTLSRYYKLQNYQVIYPIGFDSFGLPAQNAAILHGKNPRIWTQNNIKQMKQQLQCLNIDFDWDREFATHTPQYYKWTQKIFIQMYKKNLAYKSQSLVNWDPIDKTVLANEQVDITGRSWRSGALVQKKMLQQWFFKITQYSQQLQQGLEKLQWIQRVKAMQTGWIGYQKGYQIRMRVTEIDQEQPWHVDQKLKKIRQISQETDGGITVFVKDINLLFQQNCFIRYNKQDNKANEGNIPENKTKQNAKMKQKQSLIGFIQHPLDCRINIPLIVGHEQNGVTFQFVARQQQKNKKQKNNKPTYNFNKNNLSNQQIIQKIHAKQVQIMRIKDWSISRQRYWGTPIPIIYCKSCGIVPVPQQQLPVLLPEWKTNSNPLLTPQFKSCKCPKCTQPAERQTDTMDTFVDSSWYFLRFLDNNNIKQLCDMKMANFWMPVDIYIGGIQHAIMHLLYARFIMRVLSDLGVCEKKQPFKELVVQGLVKGKAIRQKSTGKYIKPQQIANYKPEQLEQTYQKMSKSKFNGLNPQTLVQKYGPDALRMALFFAAPPQNDVDFHQDLLVASDRFLKKVQQTHKSLSPSKNFYNFLQSQLVQSLSQKLSPFLSQHPHQSLPLHKILQKLQSSIQKRYMHVYIANTMQLFNHIKQLMKKYQNNYQKQLLLLFQYVFVPVLSLVAPQTVKKMYNNIKENGDQGLKKMVWPSSKLFQNFREFMIMKGNKVIKKGVIQCSVDSNNQENIRNKLQLPSDAIIKHNKKSIVIITK